jgi:Ca-activated chloride channel family protein
MNDFAAFHLLRPWWLLPALLAPLPLLLEHLRRQGAGGWRDVVAPHLLRHLLVTQGKRPRLRPATAGAMLFPILALALAGPAWQREPSPFVTDQAPMVVALDLSHAAEPALAAGKRKLRDLVAARAGARTGLVAYAGTAHLALPPTDDARLIEAYLDALLPAIMPRDGTAAAAAAKVARRALDAEGGAGTMVLITPNVPAVEGSAFTQAIQGSRHAVLLLATGPGPFEGAPGVTVVPPTPDGTDVARIAARAQRHFAAAPGDDPTLRWRDNGVWVALLALPLALVWARRGFLAAALVGVALGMAQPASAAGADWFWRLWLTPDQRARLLLERGDAAEAAALFTDPVWRGVALDRTGDHEGAAAAFGMRDDPVAHYDRGNAFMMRPQGWNDAIPAYDRALALRPGFAEARDNRAVAEAFQRQQQQAEAERATNQTDDPSARPPNPDQIVADQPPQPGDQRDPREPRSTQQQGLSDDQIQALWMRRVGGSAADFLRLRFARQAEEARP